MRDEGVEVDGGKREREREEGEREWKRDARQDGVWWRQTVVSD